MPNKNNPSRHFGCLLFFITAIFILCLIVAIVILGIPSLVENTFGPPSPRLSPRQQGWLSLKLWYQQKELTQPLDPISGDQTFIVALGESIPTIAKNLENSYLIQSGDAFRDYLLYSGLDVSVQAGEYQLSPAMTAVEIAHALQDPTPATIAFAVLPGWRAEEIAASLPVSGLQISPEAFLGLVKSSPIGFAFSADIPPGSSAEGYLVPGLYELPRQIDAKGLLQTLLNTFEANLTNELLQGFEAKGLSLHEAVILASIVQREAVVDDEMPMIASVFINRLNAGMTLAADPTVQYAIGYNETQQTWWTNPLSIGDLQFDSPYNTYIYPGLPLGPICNPETKALLAVAKSAVSPYYYFRAACDGSGRHNFAVTFEEHQANACP